MNDVVYAVGSGGSPFGMMFIAVVALLVVGAWVAFASSRFVQGGVVEHPQRVPQLYGYTACLIALIMGLASLKSVVESALTLSDPTYSSSAPWSNWNEPSITSFEAVRVTYERSRVMRVRPDSPPPEPVSEAELQRRYQALRADRIERNRVGAKRSLVISTFTLLIAIALFVLHWRWLRDRPRTAPAVPPAA